MPGYDEEGDLEAMMKIRQQQSEASSARQTSQASTQNQGPTQSQGQPTTQGGNTNATTNATTNNAGNTNTARTGLDPQGHIHEIRRTMGWQGRMSEADQQRGSGNFFGC